MRAAVSTTPRTTCTPDRCPTNRGKCRRFAHRPFPSMMMAICRGKREASRCEKISRSLVDSSSILLLFWCKCFMPQSSTLTRVECGWQSEREGSPDGGDECCSVEALDVSRGLDFSPVYSHTRLIWLSPGYPAQKCDREIGASSTASCTIRSAEPLKACHPEVRLKRTKDLPRFVGLICCLYGSYARNPAVLAKEPGECIFSWKYPRRSFVRLRRTQDDRSREVRFLKLTSCRTQSCW